MKKHVTLLILLGGILSCLMLPVFAQESVHVTFPVTIETEGVVPEDASFLLQVKSKARAGTDLVLELTHEDLENGIELPVLSFDEPGIYNYTLSFHYDGEEECEIEPSMYKMTVAVTNSEDGNGLETATVLQADGSQTKSPRATFRAVFANKGIVLPVEPDDDDSSDPSDPSDPDDSEDSKDTEDSEDSDPSDKEDSSKEDETDAETDSAESINTSASTGWSIFRLMLIISCCTAWMVGHIHHKTREISQ